MSLSTWDGWDFSILENGYDPNCLRFKHLNYWYKEDHYDESRWKLERRGGRRWEQGQSVVISWSAVPSWVRCGAGCNNRAEEGGERQLPASPPLLLQKLLLPDSPVFLPAAFRRKRSDHCQGWRLPPIREKVILVDWRWLCFGGSSTGQAIKNSPDQRNCPEIYQGQLLICGERWGRHLLGRATTRQLQQGGRPNLPAAVHNFVPSRVSS